MLPVIIELFLIAAIHVRQRMNDVEGGGLSYWSDGPDKPPARHSKAMANSALVGDIHSMFHQVEPVGPFDAGTQRVSLQAVLAPAGDDSGDWLVTDCGKEIYRAPLNEIRASVLWQADIYSSEEERKCVEHDTLSLRDIAQIFNEDLCERGADFQLDENLLHDPGTMGSLASVYPEAVPVGAGMSMFDV